MKKQLFDWIDWDMNGPRAMVFFDVTLKVPIGPFSVGARFGAADIDFEAGTLTLTAEGADEPEFVAKLGLTVHF